MSDSNTEKPEDNLRTQSVYIRPDDEIAAMAWGQRIKAKLRATFDFTATTTTTTGNNRNKKEDGPTHALEDVELQHGGGGGLPSKQVQYRLEATALRKPMPWGYKSLLTCGGRLGSRAGASGVGIHPNQRLAMYLHWMFRVNFGFLFAFMCIMFFALVIFFAALITVAGQMDDECVRIGGNPFDQQDTAFADSFALSWTTFSTVGYGSTYPALGYQNASPTNCFFINFICSLESLIGVLYSGFCGAILFGKVLRIQSHAQVIFSDPIVIRYGGGVAADDNNTHNDEEEEEAKRNPCPVLEFRIVNRLFNDVGGEIMDATLNVVANVDAVDADPLSSQRNGTPSFSSETETDSGSYADSNSARSDTSSTFHKLFDPILHMGRHHHTVDEDPSSRLVTKHIFSKMHVEASDHPFFKRVWLARHVLDENSPVLKPRVRRQIRKNGGSWPERLNTHYAIRESLKFNQILVSLNGVSNVSASDVYAQKIYDFVDINVGYQFVNILYRDSDGTLGVDTDLINDVREQNGGGGEPLIMEE